KDDPVQRPEVDEPAQQHRELVARVRAVRPDPELIAELLPLEEPEEGLGVADVDGQQRVGANLALPRRDTSDAEPATARGSAARGLRSRCGLPRCASRAPPG